MRLTFAILVAVALTLGACGVRGPLEAPPGAAPPQNQPSPLDHLL
ncbi:MAG: LPS translocon maturation chaperone LptM [Alphaproteobacteria bacterium]